MSTKILITGGAGFIGRHLTQALLDRGHRIVVLDNFSSQVHGSGDTAVDPRAELIRADVRDLAQWTPQLRDVEAIVHYAAETGTGQSMYEVARYTDVNAGGTGALLQLIASGSLPALKKVVLASSRAVYGEGKYRCRKHGAVYPPSRSAEALARHDFDVHCPHCSAVVELLPSDEATPATPLSIYALTKQFQEASVMMVARAHGLSAFALRYQNVYGPGQSLNNPYTGVLAVFATQARAGAPIMIFEDGQESRDFVYVADVVEATARCLEPSRRGDEIVNVGSGRAVTILEVARAVNAYFGNRSSVQITGESRAGDIRHNLADTRRLKAVLGFQPRWRFEDGLRAFLDWANGERVVPDAQQRYERSLHELRLHGLMTA